MIEYTSAVYVEGALSSLFFGSAKVDPARFSKFLNKYGVDDWEVVTMEREHRRLYLFWSREAYLVIFKRNKK